MNKRKKRNRITVGNKPKRLVILLAAGFSRNKGFPLGKDLNTKISNLEDHDFDFGDNQNVYKFLIAIIRHYNFSIEKGNFNYEDLFDAVDLKYNINNRTFDINNEEYRKLSEPYRTEFFTHEQLVSCLPIILNSVILSIISDDGKRNIIDMGHCEPNSYSRYANFIKFLEIESKQNIIEIFTLNHDLFIDTFRNITGLENKICDGFDDYNSTYYGTFFCNEGERRCKLERYTARYYRPIRIYKLHGSFDYFPFYKKIETGGIPLAVPHRYVKLKPGIHPLYLSKFNRRTMEYEDSLPPHANPDFLSGTEIKQAKYNNPFLYTKLFKKFKKKLSQANQVIIIGYGAKDEGINKIMYDAVNNTANVTIFNYSPDDDVYDLQKSLGAEIITGEFDEKILNLLNA